MTKLICLLLPALAFAAPPSVSPGAVVNAASFAPGITPGAWITIFGSDLANTTSTVTPADLVNGILPTQFRGTGVTINGKPAFMQFVSPGQINVQAPADTATGPVDVVVTTAEGRATVKTIASTVMPAVFAAGTHAAAVRPLDASILTATTSARPGEVLSLYANGLGATNPAVAPGVVFSGSNPSVNPPKVTIGGTEAVVSYAGLVGPGLYQLNLTVPSTLATGTYTVTVTQDGVSSPTTLLNVAPAAPPATAVTVTASSATVATGANVTFTANVTPASSAGTVTFFEGPVPLGTATLANGQASFTTAFAPGSHAVQAVFGTTNSVAVVVTASPVATCAATAGVTQIKCLADAFLATLTDSQKTTVQYGYTLSNVIRWSNLPIAIVARNGLRFGDLSSAQLSAALALFKAASSADGYERLNNIRGADESIAPLNAMFRWGAANYYIAFYGAPSATAPWMLQVAGHHHAFNHVFNGKQASGTPMFLGTEPATFTLNGNLVAPQDKQRAAFYALNQTLLSNTAARLTGTFDDVVMGVGQGGIDVRFPLTYPTGTTGRGVLVSTLSAEQQALVKKAIEGFVSDLDAATAQELLNAYQDPAALAQTYVGFAGSGSMVTIGDYIRVDGPRVWVEFVVQGSVAIRNSYHYHSLWRDKTADYGGDFN